MKIFVIRHGETDLNKAEILQGQRQDAELNESGREQAIKTIEALSGRDYSICFSSPLMRAKQTAEIIAGHFQLPIYYRDELKEKDYGSLSGKSFAEVKKITGVDRTTMNTKLDLTPYGGESVADLEKRLNHFFNELRTDYANEIPLVVTHGGLMRLMHAMLKGHEITEIANAAVHEFEI